MKLYFAYGANTNLASMAGRCPDAVPVATVTIPDHKLVFRGVADVVQQDGAKVRGAMWEITEECERSLDRFEGYPHLYVKKYVTVEWKGSTRPLMMYVMARDNTQSVPSRFYEQCLREGYADFRMSAKQIDKAIAEARAWQAARVRLAMPKQRVMVAGSRWRDDEVVQARDDFAPRQEPADDFWPDNLPPWRR